MSPVLRSLVLVAAVAVIAAVVVALWRPDGPDEAEGIAGSVSITGLGTVPPGETVAVHGFVHVTETCAGPVGSEPCVTTVLLCQRRDPGTPPRCKGPSIEVRQLDLSRVPLEAGQDEDGERLGWSSDTVVVLGERQAGRFLVQEIVS